MKIFTHRIIGKATGAKIMAVAFLCSLFAATSGAFAYKFSPPSKSDQQQHTAIGIEQPLDFKMYPNPSKGDNINVEIEGIKTEQLDIALYNTIGKIVFQKKFKPDGFQHRLALKIDPKEKLIPGLYFLSISSPTEKLAKKLVVTE